MSGGGETAPEAPAAGPVPVPSPSPSGTDANSSSRVNSSLSSNTTTEGKNVSVTAGTKKLNGNQKLSVPDPVFVLLLRLSISDCLSGEVLSHFRQI